MLKYDYLLDEIRVDDDNGGGGDPGTITPGYAISISGKEISVDVSVLDTRYANKSKFGDTFVNLTGGTTQTPDYTIVVGGSCTVNPGARNSIAVGTELNLANSYCAVFGYRLGTSAQFQLVAGRYNASDPDAYLMIGGGTSNSTRKNIFSVRKTGEVAINGWLTISVAGGSYSVVPQTIRKAATTNAAINFSLDTQIYKFAPVSSGTVTFTPPTLAADEVFQAELWVTMSNPVVSLTLPTVTWAGGTVPDMSKAGLYQMGLTYDGSDWFGRVLLVRDDSYSGDYTNGDPGVYMVVDDNVVYAAESATDLAAISGSTIYVYGSTTTFTGGTFGSGIDFYLGNDELSVTGGTVANCDFTGAACVVYEGTFSNCTFSDGSIESGNATMVNCLIDCDVLALDNSTITGGTVSTWLADPIYSLICDSVVFTSDISPTMNQTLTDCVYNNGVFADGSIISGGTVTSTGSLTYDTTYDTITNLTMEAGAYLTVNTEGVEISSGTVSVATVINNNPNE